MGDKMMTRLNDLGFELYCEPSAYDNDPSTLYVLRYHGSITIIIQVVLEGWFEKKLEARMLLKNAYRDCKLAMRYLTEEQIGMIWVDLMNHKGPYG